MRAEHHDDGHPPATTVEDYLSEWLGLQRTQLQPASWDGYRGVVERYLLPHLGELCLAELTVAVVNRAYLDLLDHGGHNGKPLAVSTVRRIHEVLHKALEDARRLGHVERNVSDDATLPRFDPRRPDGGRRELTVWTAEQLRTFLEATRGHDHHDIWTVAAGTGMRRGEILGLLWEDVDLDRGLLQVRRSLSVVRGYGARLKPPKSGRSRVLTIDERVAEAIAAQRTYPRPPRHPDAWDLVFTERTGRFVLPAHVTREFLRAVRDVPVPRIRFHDLRHSHATLLLEAGVPAKVVSERLGHSTIRLTLDQYAHVLPTMDAQAVRQFASHVWGEDDDDAGG